MAKRGYKLQEFVAHSADVNCLSIGKNCRLLITGGDDHKVNLWAIGKPTSLMSLCGHTSPVESVAFDSTEVFVLGGASTGAIKLWDLEEAKMVRTLTGHKSNCTAFEFHPFGEFFASGSMDTNLKIWDIRKKGCIHTYKGHTRGISTIRFTPDGRWVVSGGFDNVVKVWDLTAGKLLHDFTSHAGHIRSLDFHPLEFLLATGSADRTVKFWDLETFELIGSTRPEGSGVRGMTFHPDGRTLFCGLDDSLKVYSWEPVVSHDAIDMGWSTLGDLCINEGKVLACSYYRNSVGVWVADTSLIEPYGPGSTVERKEYLEKKSNLLGSLSSEEVLRGMRLTSSSRSMSPDKETKEIKNIYIDSSGGNHARGDSLSSLKFVHPLVSEEVTDVTVNRKPVTEVPTKPAGQPINKSVIVPSVVPRDGPPGKESPNSGRESITFTRTKPGMLLRPAHARRPSSTKYDVEKLSVAVESETLSNVKSESDSANGPNCRTRLILEEGAKKSGDKEECTISNIADKFEKVLSPQTPSNQVTSSESVNYSKENSVKIVRGVAVVSGRTRTLVEKFERKEKFTEIEDKTVDQTCTQPLSKASNPLTTIASNPPTTMEPNPPTSTTPKQTASLTLDQPTSMTPIQSPTTPIILPSTTLIHSTSTTSNQLPKSTLIQSMSVTANQNSCTTPDHPTSITVNPPTSITPDRPTSINPPTSNTPNQKTKITLNRVPSKRRSQQLNVSPKQPTSITPNQATVARQNQQLNMTRSQSSSMRLNQQLHMTPNQPTSMTLNLRTSMTLNSRTSTTRTSVTRTSMTQNPRASIILNPPTTTTQTQVVTSMTSNQGFDSTFPEMEETPNILKGEPQFSGRDSTAASDVDITDNLMQTHDVFLSTLRGRLTKLQVVKHFWEGNDIKGAIGALRKLPDHAVQADVIGVLMEKVEILTLDLFASLLPVLTGLLDSKTERHANVSLELLMKLVAVFNPVIHSTISARRSVGVDLHAEERLKCCNQCFLELQKTQKILPSLIRRGGLLARKGHELTLVLQEC